MRGLLLGALVLSAAAAAPAAARLALYVEPAAGPRMTIDNLKLRKRVLGTDKYCIREVTIDGARVFGGDQCRVKHGEKKTLRLAPGPHEIVFDTISQWGTYTEPYFPPIELKAKVDAADKDFAVLLRDSQPPEVVTLEAGDAALLAASSAAAPAPPAPAVSTGAAAGAQPPAAPAAAAPDPFSSLVRLKELYDKGVITEDEFKAKKAELLKQIR